MVVERQIGFWCCYFSTHIFKLQTFKSRNNMSSSNKNVQKDRINDTVNNQVPLVTGVFAQPIMKRYIDTGLPMSTIPLRTPGCSNMSFLQGLSDIPYTEQARCKCQKAKCLQLYCECFARCFQCGPNCKCEWSCQNNDQSEECREKRNQTIMDLIKKDPLTFRTGVKRKLHHQNSVSATLVRRNSKADVW